MRHEDTIVYRKCLELMATAREAIEQFPRGYAFLAARGKGLALEIVKILSVWGRKG